MADGSVAKRSSGKWLARYRPYPGAREITKSFVKKDEGKKWLSDKLASLGAGNHIDPDGEKMLLCDYIKVWEKTQSSDRNSTKSITRNALDVHIVPALGHHPLGMFRRSTIQAFVNSLKIRLGPGSAKNVYARLQNIFDAAVYDRKIAQTPCQKIKLAKVVREEITPPTLEQVMLLRDALPGRYQALPVFLALSGLRIAEAMALRVTDVDFLRQTVRVERQRIQKGNALGPVKSEASDRTVPLSDTAIAVLAAHLAVYKTNEWVFRPKNYKVHDYLTYGVWIRVWTEARDKVKLRGVDTHDLRHFFASVLISGGCSVKQVQAAMGHETAMYTLDVYGHLWPGDEDRTRAVIDAQCEILRTGCGPADAEISVLAGQRG